MLIYICTYSKCLSFVMWPCQAVDGELPAPDSCGANICWFCNLRHAASARSLVVEAPPTETEQAGFLPFWTQALRFGLLRSVWGMAQRFRTRCPAFRRYTFQVFVIDCQARVQAGKQHGAGVYSSGEEEAALPVELFTFWLDALRFDF